MQDLIHSEEEGGRLWADTFAGLLDLVSRDRRRAHLQLLELMRVGEMVAIQNQDDRGCVALLSFLGSVPDDFFLASAPTMDARNRAWWRLQVEESMLACPGTTLLLRKRVERLCA